MVDDITMLETITETTDMGRDSLNHVMGKATDSGLKSALQKQYAQYDETYKSAEKMLVDKGREPQKVGGPVKLYSHMVSTMKTMTADNDTSKVAEMVIQGSTMGISEMTKQLNDYQDGDQTIRGIAEKHIKNEQKNIDEMKTFL